MSADVWIDRAACKTCGRCAESDDEDALNITYNLSKMLGAAGFVGWRNIEGASAPMVGHHILWVLNLMDEEPERWRAMNPENGWGDYDSCIQGRMRKWAQRCIAAQPDDKIGAWL